MVVWTLSRVTFFGIPWKIYTFQFSIFVYLSVFVFHFRIGLFSSLSFSISSHKSRISFVIHAYFFFLNFPIFFLAVFNIAFSMMLQVLVILFLVILIILNYLWKLELKLSIVSFSSLSWSNLILLETSLFLLHNFSFRLDKIKSWPLLMTVSGYVLVLELIILDLNLWGFSM